MTASHVPSPVLHYLILMVSILTVTVRGTYHQYNFIKKETKADQAG